MHWSATSCLLVCILNLAVTDLSSVLASNHEHQGAIENDEHIHEQGTGNFDRVYSDIGTHDARNDLNDKQEVRDVSHHSDADAGEGDRPVIGADELAEGQRHRRSVINPGLLFYTYRRVAKEQRGEKLPHHRKRMEDNLRQRRVYAGDTSAAETEGVSERVEHKRNTLNKAYEVKMPSSAARKRRNVVYDTSNNLRGARHDSEAENEKPFWKVRFGREETTGPFWKGRFGRGLRDTAPMWTGRYGRDGREVAPPWSSRYGRDAHAKSLITYRREARNQLPFWKGRFAGREVRREAPFWNGRYGRETANQKPPWAWRFGRDAEEINDSAREVAPHIWKSRFGRESKRRGEQVAKEERLEAAINAEFMTGENHHEGRHEQHLANHRKDREEQELENEDTQPSVRFGRSVYFADAVDVDRDGSRMKRKRRGSGRVVPRIVNHVVLPQRSHSSGKEFIYYRPIMYAVPDRAIRYGEVQTQRYDPKMENWPAQSRSQQAPEEMKHGDGNERAEADRDTTFEDNDLAGTGFDVVDGVEPTKDREAEDTYGNRFVYQMERLRHKIRDTEMKEGLAATREGIGFSRGKSNRSTPAGRPRSRNLNRGKADRSELEMIENILHGKIHTSNDGHMQNVDDYYEQIKDDGL